VTNQGVKDANKQRNPTLYSEFASQVGVMARAFRFVLNSLVPFCVMTQWACSNDTTTPEDIVPLTKLDLGLDIRYPTITGGPSGHIFTIRPNDITSKRLDSRDADGTLLWSVSFTECTQSCSRMPVVDQAGNVYMATAQGLMSWNSSGNLRWTAPGVLANWVAIGSNSRLYVSSALTQANQQIYALNASTGAGVWTAVIPGGGVFQVLVDEVHHNVYAVQRGGPVALNIDTGAIRFTARPLLGATCFGGDGSIDAAGTIYIGCDNDMLSRIGAYSSTGEAKWQKSMGAASGTSTLIDEDGVLYVSNPISITAMTTNGDQIWRADSIFTSTVIPVIDKQKNIYVIAQRKRFADFELLVINAGKIVENKGTIINPSNGSFLLAANGRVYYNAGGSLIYFGTKGSSSSAQWPQAGRDPGRSSRQ
jgi:outer membrane protein assembly factor BamB